LDFPKTNEFLGPSCPPRPCNLQFRKKRDAMSKTLQPKCEKQLHVECPRSPYEKNPIY